LNRELRRYGPFEILDRPAEGVPELELEVVYESHASRARGLLGAKLALADAVVFEHRTVLFSDLKDAAKEISGYLITTFNEQCTDMPLSDPSAQTEEAEPLIVGLTDEAKSLLDDAVRLHEDGRLEDAVAVWRRYLRLMPEDSFGYANLAVTQLQLKDYRGAARSLERSVKLNGQNDIALYNLAFTYYRLGRPQRALRAIEATLQVNPYHEKALSLLARIRAERI
jgi:tetratricopeptide (TPR) repeat protein